MPIRSDDMKLLRSAVMENVPEGGGAMSGVEVVDGQSNNIFPDTSTIDRTLGRFQGAKVFGAAHTNDTDVLLGAHFGVLQPPEDPLVHVSLFQTPGWADELTTARELVERYTVKGRRLASRILETQYTGSRLLQLYQVGGADFPAAGDSVALRNGDGSEQYVRVLKVSVGSSTFFAVEGGGTTSFVAQVAVCELATPLTADVLGPPVGRAVTEGNTYAIAYSTTVAAGSEFHSVKPLGVAAAVGDRTVQLAGGIYIPLVPAATREEPLNNLAPLLRRQSLSRTGVVTLTLPARTLALQPGSTLRLPVAAQPGTVSVTAGATVFTDDGAGQLLQGTVMVASIDYRGRSITFAPASPSYPNASVAVSYMPATPAGAATHSDSLLITQANQGLAFTAAFEPPPAPGTFSLSYMAQGRWYDLLDNGNGRLSGVDSSYGAGSINYQTGSIAYTLGAIPDAGGRIIYQWGDAAEAETVPLADRPSALSATLTLDPALVTSSLTLAWAVNGQPRTASCNAAGVISGAGTGTCRDGVVTLAPADIPDTGSIAATFDRLPSLHSSVTNNGSGAYTLGVTPVTPGSLRVVVGVVPQSGFDLPSVISAQDDGTGQLISSTHGVPGSVGSVNYTTGAVTINATVAGNVYESVVFNAPPGSPRYYATRVLRPSHTLTLSRATVTSWVYTSGVATTSTVSPELAWGLQVPVLLPLALAADAIAFSVGNQVYTAAAGVLSRDWHIVTGTGTAAGAVASNGQISVTAPPTAGQPNVVVWRNVAASRASGQVGQGVFRVETAPIKTGVFQIQAGALLGSANAAGVISGGGWSGTVDYLRGIVTWSRTNNQTGVFPWSTWVTTNPIAADQLTYNAVFLQNVPLDAALLGLDTARLPLDGLVPGYRGGGIVLVHNTQTTVLPVSPTRDLAYSLGRQRLGAVTLRSASGVRVPGDRYEVDLDNGTVTIPAAASLLGIDQPMTVYDRIQDSALVMQADISGQLALASGLTHNYPAGTSFVSSLLLKGDLFARAFGYLERTSWAGSWPATAAATSQPTASYNRTDYPVLVTNRGAIAERWAVIFTSTTLVRVVGENVGQVLTNVSITAAIEALNPQTGAMYFRINPLGWGGGWAAGNVLLFETAACGSPVWVARTVLQGPATEQSDRATLLFAADVDA